MNNLIIDFDLFIFDLDDTLVQTEKYHYTAWLITLKNAINDDFYFDFSFFCSKFHSMMEDGIKRYLIDELKIPQLLYETIYNQKTSTYLHLIHNDKYNLRLIENADIFLNEILNNLKKFVIVTNTSKCNLDFYLEKFPILKKSEKNYYREMMTNKKPNPECYLKVCSDFPNLKKIGFEDSLTGIHALSLVPSIKSVFINSTDYYYYDYIIKNYDLLLIINNYMFSSKMV